MREIEIRWAGRTLRVGYEWSRPRPARTNCLPEDSCPAEGGLEGIHTVHLVRRGDRDEKARPLTDKCIAFLIDMGLEEWLKEAIYEAQEGDKEADAEERADARREEMMEDKAEGREW